MYKYKSIECNIYCPGGFQSIIDEHAKEDWRVISIIPIGQLKGNHPDRLMITFEKVSVNERSGYERDPQAETFGWFIGHGWISPEEFPDKIIEAIKQERERILKIIRIVLAEHDSQKWLEDKIWQSLEGK